MEREARNETLKKRGQDWLHRRRHRRRRSASRTHTHTHTRFLAMQELLLQAKPRRPHNQTARTQRCGDSNRD